jgi:soluble lytic murein transglycosylase-like protein
MSEAALAPLAAARAATGLIPRDLERASPAALKDAFEALLAGELLAPLEESLRRSGLFPGGSAGEIYAYFWKNQMSSLLAGSIDLLPGWQAPSAAAAGDEGEAAALESAGSPLRPPATLRELPPTAVFRAAPERSAIPAAARLTMPPALRAILAPAADATATAASASEPPSSGGAAGRLHARLAPFDAVIDEAAAAASIAANWVRAVIIQESGGRADAVSPKGAQGMMQLIPATAAALGVEDAFDPVENIRAGTRYLGGLLRRFGDMRLALAAYNAGPTRVAAYGGLPPFRETQTYVARVVELKEELDGALGGVR